MSARVGKIARLPFEVREEICRRLRDGHLASQINLWLVSQRIPSAPFSDQNFTNWRQGGYQDWLKQQSRLDVIRSSAEDVARMRAAGADSIADRLLWDYAEAAAAARLTPDADPASISKLAAAAAAIINAATARQRADTDRRKADIAARAADLEERKFKARLAEGFLDWFADDRARAIASGADSRADKIQALLAFMDQQETAAP